MAQVFIEEKNICMYGYFDVFVVNDNINCELLLRLIRMALVAHDCIMNGQLPADAREHGELNFLRDDAVDPVPNTFGR